MQLDPSLYLPLAGAVTAIVVGLGLRMWVSRRAFYRRNAAGIEEFKSYTAKVVAGFIEGGASLTGVVLMLAGVFYAISILMKIKV